MIAMSGIAAGGTLHEYAALAGMWAAMMATMMLPSAVPMLGVYTGAARERASAPASIAAFALGYVSIWTTYSAAAALLQMALTRLDLLSAAMEPASAALSGSLLFAAGLYQWTPPKHACLHRCRSPLSFVLLYWRDGIGGALAMGVRHGLFCAGCCWALMLLLFAGGVMNPWWIAGLASLALAEKRFARGAELARVCGAAMIAAGTWMLLRN